MCDGLLISRVGAVRPDLVGAGVPWREAVHAGGAGARHQQLRRGQPGGRRELRPRVQGPAARRHRRRHQAPRRRAAAGFRRRGIYSWRKITALCRFQLLTNTIIDCTFLLNKYNGSVTTIFSTFHDEILLRNKQIIQSLCYDDCI